MALSRFAFLLVGTLVLSTVSMSAAPQQANIDAAIAQANAMVKLGMPANEVEQWLLQQVRSGGGAQTSITVQSPPPGWDAYAVASWKQQEQAATGGAKPQGEDVYTRTRLGTYPPDQDLPHGTSDQAADVHQRGAQAANPVHAPSTSPRTDDVRSGVGGPARQ